MMLKDTMLKLPRCPDPFARPDPRFNGCVYALFSAFFYVNQEVFIFYASVACSVLSAIMANVKISKSEYLNDAIYLVWISCLVKTAIDQHAVAFAVFTAGFIPVYVVMRIVGSGDSP